MSRQPFSPLLILGFAAVVASATCYKIVPETPYVPHIEEQPCNAGATGDCDQDFYVCQQGDQCGATLLGKQPCTNIMANRPMRVYRGGFVNGFGCCEGSPASYVGLDPLLTCPTPMGMLGVTSCALWEPAPE